MKFTVAQPVKVKSRKEGLYLFMKFMHGDADKYETVMVLQTSDDAEGHKTLEEAIECIKTVQLIMDRDHMSEKIDKLIWASPLSDDWLGDVTADHQFRASCEDYYVRYFDKSGIEYEVLIGE